MIKLLHGDCLKKLQELEDNSINSIVTSPPYYGLRVYNAGESEIGLEQTPQEYVQKLIDIFREIWRVLQNDGTVWLNLGDSYAGSGKAGSNPEYQKKHTQFGQKRRKERLGEPQPASSIGLKPKDLIGIPWRIAFALQDDGWYLRQDIIWQKPNPMPSSVTDRCTTNHEYIFLLTKKQKYYYDQEAIKEPLVENSDMNYRKTLRCGRKYGVKRPYKNNQPLSYNRNVNKKITHKNKRSVWTVNTRPCSEAHFAVFPQKLIEPCILAGCPQNGTVLDPFMGRGTIGEVAIKHKRNFIGIELNEEYLKMANKNIDETKKSLGLLNYV